MFRPTHLGLVVFTQGYPVLERFAQEHFLPSNPFSSSCLWLDEDDLRGIEISARRAGVPYPLRIDPYAHHPVRSRFAVTKTQALSSSAGKQAPEGAAVRRDSGDAPPRSSGSSTTTTNAPPPRRQRGRPRKAVPSATVHTASADRVTAVDPSHYTVPIFSMLLPKPLFLFNLDQMYRRTPLDEMWVSQDGTSQLQSAAEATQHTFPLRLPWGSPLNLGGELHVLPLGTSVGGQGGELAADPVAMPGLVSALLTQHKGDGLQHGVRQLQAMLPNPSRFGESQMYSVQTRKPYGPYRQADLRKLARRHQYQSLWWGTRQQWSRVGAVPLPGQCAHIIPVSTCSKLVHISLIENAAELLRHSYISPHRRKLCYVFDAEDEMARGNSGGRGGATDAGTELHDRYNASFSPSSSVVRDAYAAKFLVFFHTIKADMQHMHYRLPLYLSHRHIQSLGLTLRPGAPGIMPREQEGALQDMSESDPATSAVVTSPSSRPKITHHCWYHLSQVHFPSSHLIASAVLSAEMASPGLALNGTTGAPLSAHELTYASLVDHHPEIAAVIGRGGSSVTPLTEPAAVSAFVAAYASPSVVQGRHLWFEAKDVLAANGIVDVNSAPVEVTEQQRSTQRFAGSVDVPAVAGAAGDTLDAEEHGSLGDSGSGTLFNVELVSSPDEALRKLCTPFEAV